MKRQLILLASLLLICPLAMAYQVTGPVTEMTDSKVVVMKGKEKFEMARDAGTKMKGDVKVGDKVTIEYKMTATSIEAKGGGKAKAKK